MRELSVTSDLRPGRIRISWTERAPGVTRPSFQLIRRRFAFPTSASDGALVFDIDALFQPPALVVAWDRIDREVCIAGNSRAEDGFVRGVLEVFHAGTRMVAVVSVLDSGGVMQRPQFSEVSRVLTYLGLPPSPYTRARHHEIYETPGGGAEVYRGVVRFLEGAPNNIPNHMSWQPAVGPASAVKYGQRRAETTSFDGRVFRADGGSTLPSRQLTIESQFVPEAGLTEWRFALEDGELEPGAFYYYRLFSPTDAPNDPPVRGSALATGDFGAHDLMYRLLPPVHQVQDVDDTKIDGGRPLYRFLEAFGRAVDHFRGLVDAVATRHEIATARADFLPHLARMIGWIPDFTVPENTQRQDIRFAPEIFGGLGTLPSAPALVNRVTGWPCKVKEFAHNVLLTNAPEFIPIWEIWQVTRSAAGVWSAPGPLSLTTSMDGAPAVLLVGGIPWVIWHSDRGGQRELWFQRLGQDVVPQRVMGPPPPGADMPAFADESPALVMDGSDVRVFWTSNRAGSHDIYTTTMNPADAHPVAGPLVRLTDHPMDDSHPAAVNDGTNLWLFWDSDRRGPRDVWYQRRTGGLWSAPARMPKPAGKDLAHDSSPATLLVVTDVWLFWCRDIGDRREIWHQVIPAAGVPGTAQQLLSEDPRGGVRDEAPSPVSVPTSSGSQIWLLFHSNRGGPWQIWTRVHDSGWQASAHQLSSEVTADTEPTGFIDSAGLRVIWTSQRRTRWYKSRTLDLSDSLMLSEIGTLSDHGHYVYDTDEKDDDWYARGVVGLYLEPNQPADITLPAKRANAFLDPFRPACVRYVWPTEHLAHEEAIEVGAFAGESWADNL